MMRIHFEDLRVEGTHGHYEHEWAAPQNFLVSLSVTVSSTTAARDALGTTIDYDVLRSIVRDVFSGERVALIETLAQIIIAKIQEDPRVEEVSITIRKLDAWDNGIPGITIVSKQ